LIDGRLRNNPTHNNTVDVKLHSSLTVAIVNGCYAAEAEHGEYDVITTLLD